VAPWAAEDAGEDAEAEGAPDELPEDEPTTRLAKVEALEEAWEAVEAADWEAELAVETAGCAVELAVDTAEPAADDAVLVTLEVETGGAGTVTGGGTTVGVLTDGVETVGKPEARLAGAPDPTAAPSTAIRTPTRISDLARFIDMVPSP
jgi:hypothetical protein